MPSITQVVDGWWWWRGSPNSKWKVVFVSDHGTAIRKIGSRDPMQVRGEFGPKLKEPPAGYPTSFVTT